MNRILRFFGVVSFVGLLMALEGCAALHGGGARKTNADVSLVSFGSLNGELAPCG